MAAPCMVSLQAFTPKMVSKGKCTWLDPLDTFGFSSPWAFTKDPTKSIGSLAPYQHILTSRHAHLHLAGICQWCSWHLRPIFRKDHTERMRWARSWPLQYKYERKRLARSLSHVFTLNQCICGLMLPTYTFAATLWTLQGRVPCCLHSAAGLFRRCAWVQELKHLEPMGKVWVFFFK